LEVLILSITLSAFLSLAVLRAKRHDNISLAFIREFGVFVAFVGVVVLERWTSVPLLKAVVVGSFAFYLVGLSVANNLLSWRWGLLFEVVVAVILTRYGLRVDFILGLDGRFHYLGWYSIPISVLWVVLVSNSIRFLDIIEGVASGVIVISAITFYLVAYFQQQALFDAMNLSLVIIGLLIGRFDKTFSQWGSLGGGLSSFFGFLLSAVTIMGVMKRTAFLTLFVPLLILGVPILNTSYRLAVSWTTGRARDLYYRFIDMGLGHRQVLLFIYLFNIYLCSIAVFLVVGNDTKLGLLLLVSSFLFVKVVEAVLRRKHSRRRFLRGSVSCFGVKVDSVSLSGAVSKVLGFLMEGKRLHQVVTLNSLGVLDARKDEQFREIVNSAELVVPDGIGLVWGARVLGYMLPEKVAGIELTTELIKLSGAKGYNIYLLGSKPGVAEKAVQRLLKIYPEARIVGAHHGYLDEGLTEGVIEDVNAKDTDILLVGMGMPKQEKWIYNNREKLKVAVAIGVGGSIDIWADVSRRAPKLFVRLGLEWLYRLLSEPWRYKRIARLSLFVLLIFKEALWGKR